MNVATYDPHDVRTTFNGVEFKGFADGTLIEVERQLPDSPPHARINPISGAVEITLEQVGGDMRELWHQIKVMPVPPEVLRQRYAWLKQLRLVFRQSRRRRRMALRRRRGRGACSV